MEVRSWGGRGYDDLKIENLILYVMKKVAGKREWILINWIAKNKELTSEENGSMNLKGAKVRAYLYNSLIIWEEGIDMKIFGN